MSETFNSLVADTREVGDAETYEKSFQRITKGIQLFREKVIETYLPSFSSLPERYRAGYIFDSEIDDEKYFLSAQLSELGDLVLFDFIEPIENLKKEILSKCPPVPVNVPEAELQALTSSETLPEWQQKRLREKKFADALAEIDSGISQLEETVDEKLLKEVYPYYSETEGLEKNLVVVSVVERELKNLGSLLEKFGLKGVLEIKKSSSFFERLTESCENKKSNDEAEEERKKYLETAPRICKPIIEAVRAIRGEDFRSVTVEELMAAGVSRPQLEALVELSPQNFLDQEECDSGSFSLDEEKRILRGFLYREGSCFYTFELPDVF